MVTLIIISFIFAGIFGFISQLGIIKRVSVSVSEKTEITVLESFLKKRVENARRIPIFSEGFLQQRFLDGEADTFTFVSEVRRGTSGRGLFDVSLKWNKQTGTLSEIHSFRRLSNESFRQSSEYPIFRDLYNVTISYGGHTSSFNDFTWSDEWKSIKSLPSFIRFSGIYRGFDGDEAFSFLLSVN